MTDFRSRVVSSPVGDILLVSGDDDAYVWIHPFDGPVAFERDRVSRMLGAPVLGDDPADGSRGSEGDAALQLAEYFAGARTAFDLRLDWRLVHGFAREALRAVQTVPYGETAAYGEVAILAGKPRAARAVGTACARTPFSVVVPVHRVVRADGSIGEYGGHPEVKRYLLDLERTTGV